MNVSVDLKTELYDWLKKNHHGKLSEYSVYRHQKILDLVLNWMMTTEITTFEQLRASRMFQWLDFYFSRFEFLPLSDWNDDLEQKEIYSKLHYSPLVVSFSTEKGCFKFFIIKKDPETLLSQTYRITKSKFKILDDESIHDLTGDRYFKNYEEMKKILINNSPDQDSSKDPKVAKLIQIRSKMIPTKSIPVSDSFIIDHFSNSSESRQVKINFNNGSLFFSSYPLRLWSNTLSVMMDEFSNTSIYELDLKRRNEIFILYSLFRISNFFKTKISTNILRTLSKTIPDFPEINEDFSQDLIIKNILELYWLCDFLEDKKALCKLLDLFQRSKLDKYEKQKFYDMLFNTNIWK